MRASVSVDEVWERLRPGAQGEGADRSPSTARLREGLILFTYLHIAADEPLTRALLDSGITAVAYETVEVGRALPLLAPMSEVAGRLASQAGAYFLEKPLGGRGLLLGGVPGVAPGRVVIVGGGVVGYNAAVIALGLGAQVTILERSIDRMRHLEEILSGRVTLLDELEPAGRRVGRGGRPRDRRRADPGRGRAEARDARDDRGHEGGRGRRRRRDRPGRLLRDLARDDARRSRVRRRRRHALLRREHAGRGADHLDEGADERDAARTSRRSRTRACARRSRTTRRSRRAST